MVFHKLFVKLCVLFVLYAGRSGASWAVLFFFKLTLQRLCFHMYFFGDHTWLSIIFHPSAMFCTTSE